MADVSLVIALRWLSMDLIDNMITMVLVMTWCRQATSHCLRQFRPDLCRHMASLGHHELKNLRAQKQIHQSNEWWFPIQLNPTPISLPEWWWWYLEISYTPAIFPALIVILQTDQLHTNTFTTAVAMALTTCRKFFACVTWNHFFTWTYWRGLQSQSCW